MWKAEFLISVTCLVEFIFAGKWLCSVLCYMLGWASFLCDMLGWISFLCEMIVRVSFLKDATSFLCNILGWMSFPDDDRRCFFFLCDMINWVYFRSKMIQLFSFSVAGLVTLFVMCLMEFFICHVLGLFSFLYGVPGWLHFLRGFFGWVDFVFDKLGFSFFSFFSLILWRNICLFSVIFLIELLFSFCFSWLRAFPLWRVWLRACLRRVDIGFLYFLLKYVSLSNQGTTHIEEALEAAA
jgi:hypothetical protein